MFVFEWTFKLTVFASFTEQKCICISIDGEVMMLFYLLPPSFYTLVIEANT